MKILVYGDSNTRGLEPSVSNHFKDAEKFYYTEKDLWWYPLLEDNFLYIDGLPGRCIDNEALNNPFQNASKMISSALKDNYDLVILQLGATDCDTEYNLSSTQIAESMKNLVTKIQEQSSSQILLISPAKFDMTKKSAKQFYADGDKKSVELDKFYSEIAQKTGVNFVSGLDIPVGIDGMHFTLDGHKMLGQRVCEKIAEIDKQQSTPKPIKSNSENYSKQDIENARNFLKEKMR